MNFIDVLVTATLALIMFGVGSSLTVQHFKIIFIKPKPVLVGLMSQMLFLPLLAFLFGYFSNLNVEYKIGLIVLSLCPGGTTSNFMVYLLKGNTALSILMTTLNSMLTLLTIPLMVGFSLDYFLGVSGELMLPFFETMIQIFCVTIIPVLMGLGVRYRIPKLAHKLNQKIAIKFFNKAFCGSIISIGTIVLLGIIFGIKLFASKNGGGAELSRTDIMAILPIAMLFNFSALLLGFVVAKIFRLKDQNPMTIAIEVGLQNTTLAFLIAGTLLKSPEMQKPALVYAFFSFWTALLFGLLTKQTNPTPTNTTTNNP